VDPISHVAWPVMHGLHYTLLEVDR